jgi:hypothetical protein
MSLKQLIEATMKQWEWEDDIKTNEDGNLHSVSTNITLDENDYHLFLEMYDSSQLIKIWMYSPFKLPEKRFNDTCVVLNRLNKNIYAGYLNIIEDKVRFYHCIDVEHCTPEVQLVTNMRKAAGNAFRPNIVQALGALAYTKMSAEDIIAQFEAPDED